MDKIDYKGFQTSALQATIYTPDMDHSASKVLSRFFPKCADIFDADPESLPNLPGLPPEVPRVILRDKNNTLRFEIAASRINFYRLCKADEQNGCDNKEFYNNAISYFSLFQDELKCRFARFAALRTVFAFHDTPGKFLARHFCKETWEQAPLNRPESFELHSHKIYNLNDFTVNSWARSKTGTANRDNKSFRVVVFEQDLNTLAKELSNKEYKSKDISMFYDSVIPEFDDILCQYYPENNGG